MLTFLTFILYIYSIGSTHELQGLDKVNGVINAQYSELKDNLGELSTYYKQFNDQGKFTVIKHNSKKCR